MEKWLNNKSRMKREFHVRFCERLAGKFRWPTRPLFALRHPKQLQLGHSLQVRLAEGSASVGIASVQPVLE